MRDRWYGDHRDLVKWGTLLELARKSGLKHILQILYYRTNDWPAIEVDGEAIDLAADAIRHFRDSTRIINISNDLQVEALVEEFTDRQRYLESIKDSIRSRRIHPGIVFLDPDTGLEPDSGKFGPTHVRVEELVQIWGTLNAGDFLVFYQHQDNRAGKEWKNRKRVQFAEALGLVGSERLRAKLAHAPSIAQDVAFFFIEKA